MPIRTSGKKFEALQRRLRRQNRAFERMSPSQQRVRIAKDVIAQIRLGELEAYSCYFNSQGLTDARRGQGRTIEDMDLGAAVAQTTCSVCGIGSLFVAAVRRNDKITVHDFTSAWQSRDAETNYLSEWFSNSQLDLVEKYYERNADSTVYAGNEDIEISPIEIELDNNKRLIMIMENIISNNGKFNPKRGAHRDLSAKEIRRAVKKAKADAEKAEVEATAAYAE